MSDEKNYGEIIDIKDRRSGTSTLARGEEGEKEMWGRPHMHEVTKHKAIVVTTLLPSRLRTAPTVQGSV
eukprot:1566234-Heterocapsa_arctica.AAC.1